MSQKIFSSALSKNPDAMKAIEEVAAAAAKDLDGRPCDVAVLFFSEGYAKIQPQKVIEKFSKRIKPRFLIGCNSSGVIGDNKEIEMEPAISMMAMHLPEVQIRSFTLTPHELTVLSNGGELAEHLEIFSDRQPKFICLADPMSCDVTKLLRLFNEGYGESPVIGGLASGIAVGVENWLILDGDIFADGAVGLALSGDLTVESVVSQGCRPIGEPLIITGCEQNVLRELAGRPVLEVLGALYESLPPKDQNAMRNSLFVGLLMDESLHKLGRGDFLIRNIMGVDYDKGVMVIGEMLECGQTFQFQLRDARTAEADLKKLLRNLPKEDRTSGCGAILISCCGRGRGLFSEPDHDIAIIQSARGPFPVAGFFANGEFGPVAKKNYIHGYTSSLTILR